MKSRDENFMRRALQLANQAELSVSPNPRVGSVIVFNEEIVGEGYHRGPGFPHAEVEAIRDAEARGFADFQNAELFVTLEPCVHLKKRTPPCVPLLASKGFRRIVVSHLDPHPEVSGAGVKALRERAPEVSVGVLADDAAQLNQAFLKNQIKNMPYLSLKIAMTFDGKLADDAGRSRWITEANTREFVHELRRKVDAIVVGKGTIERDNPKLNVRLPRLKSSEQNIIVFGRPKNLSRRLQIFRANSEARVLFVEIAKKLSFTTSRFRLLQAPTEKAALRWIYQNLGLCHWLVEGGPSLASALLRLNLIDDAFLFYGRGFVGGKGEFSLGRDWKLKSLSKSAKFSPDRVGLIGSDVFVHGSFHVYRPDTIQSGSSDTPARRAKESAES